MSRVLLLKLTEAEAANTCATLDVQISVIEQLESGGIRLVCTSSSGAALLRHKLRTKVIDGPVKRSRAFSKGMQPFSSTTLQREDRRSATPFSARADRW